MRHSTSAAILVVGLFAVVAASTFLSTNGGPSPTSGIVATTSSLSGTPTISSTTTVVVSSTSASSTTASFISTTTSNSATALAPCGTAGRTVTISGSNYCLIDVSNDIVVGAPGYSYFINRSVTYMGVDFQTICPSSYQGCPNSTTTSTQMMIGAIKFNMTFPDKTVETQGSVIGDSEHVLIVSNHVNPKAGMQIDYGPGLTTP